MSGGWNTIESDAGVFTYLVDNLGVKDVQFEELIALDADYLKQQNPVYGVIFLFKYPTGETSTDVPKDGTFDHAAADDLFFAAQTIQNACGTQALLSVLLNQSGEGRVDVGDKLREFADFTNRFPAELRGEALSNSELIRDVHNSFARASPFIDETQRTATSDDEVYHFIAYTPINGTLFELDGLQPFPISHGPCSFPEFPEKIIPVLQRRIGRYPANEIRFNLLAMVRDLRIRARDEGDQEMLWREERKRREWQWENALRRHNFVGFVSEVLKGVVRAKVKEGGGSYERWVEEGVKRTRTRLEERSKKGGGETDEDI
ncbi:hypothetical protein MMC19_002462 [Ptychographa xylographoides]|nr:hypothetical protein [Ptychographa xylographoides]